MITGATLICLHVQNSCSAKVLLAEISPLAMMVFMPVNQMDTAFEYAAIFVCWIIFRVSQQHRECNCYMIMHLNIVVDHLHYISTYTYFIWRIKLMK